MNATDEELMMLAQGALSPERGEEIRAACKTDELLNSRREEAGRLHAVLRNYLPTREVDDEKIAEVIARQLEAEFEDSDSAGPERGSTRPRLLVILAPVLALAACLAILLTRTFMLPSLIHWETAQVVGSVLKGPDGPPTEPIPDTGIPQDKAGLEALAEDIQDAVNGAVKALEPALKTRPSLQVTLQLRFDGSLEVAISGASKDVVSRHFTSGEDLDQHLGEWAAEVARQLRDGPTP